MFSFSCNTGAKGAVPKLTGAGLANFFALRGRRIIEACGAFWYSAPHGFLMSLPYQRSLDPTAEAIQILLRSSGAVGVRFPSERWRGIPGGTFIYRYGGRNYDLRSVHIKQRPRVQKGLQTFEIRPVGEGDLLNQGLQLNRETMLRHHHYDPEFGDAARWAHLVRVMRECPEIGAIGAFNGNRLSAYMITCREDGWLNILHQMSRHDELVHFPNHVLTYSVTKAASEDPSLEGVCYGLLSLAKMEGLDEYKLRFGYQLVPRTCAVVLHPRLNLLLGNRFILGGAQLLRGLRPGNQHVAMMAAILRGAAASSPA